MAFSESSLNTNAISNTGDYGIVQINLEQPPILEKGQELIIKEQALDPEFALNFAAKAITLDKQSAWVVCNCFSFVKTKIRNIPQMDDIKPNSVPTVGGIVIMNYRGVKHIAYIEKILENGVLVFESNYRPCSLGKRVIEWTDPSLIGYWTSNQSLVRR